MNSWRPVLILLLTLRFQHDLICILSSRQNGTVTFLVRVTREINIKHLLLLFINNTKYIAWVFVLFANSFWFLEVKCRLCKLFSIFCMDKRIWIFHAIHTPTHSIDRSLMMWFFFLLVVFLICMALEVVHVIIKFLWVVGRSF